jgi:hypothetical protein
MTVKPRLELLLPCGGLDSSVEPAGEGSLETASDVAMGLALHGALHRWKWSEVRRRLLGPGRPMEQADGGRGRTVQHRLGAGYSIPIPRRQDPQPLDPAQPRLNGGNRGEPLPGDRHGGFGERPGKRTRSNPDTAPQADSTTGHPHGWGWCGRSKPSYHGVIMSPGQK